MLSSGRGTHRTPGRSRTSTCATCSSRTSLVVLRNEYALEPRELGPYLDLAGCEGEARERAEALAPPNYTAELGWYLLERR